MSILNSIEVNHFQAKIKKNWDKTYWFFDLHSTIIKPNYQRGKIPKEFYPHAKEVLQAVSKLDDICMIMYTCSHLDERQEYLEYFKENDIHFDYINENPEVKTQKDGYGYYEDKPYMNVLFEDKAGFDAETEWKGILDLLKERYEEI